MSTFTEAEAADHHRLCRTAALIKLFIQANGFAPTVEQLEQWSVANIDRTNSIDPYGILTPEEVSAATQKQ